RAGDVSLVVAGRQCCLENRVEKGRVTCAPGSLVARGGLAQGGAGAVEGLARRRAALGRRPRPLLRAAPARRALVGAFGDALDRPRRAGMRGPAWRLARHGHLVLVAGVVPCRPWRRFQRELPNGAPISRRRRGCSTPLVWRPVAGFVLVFFG